MTDHHRFFCGLGLGVVVGHLFAPREGAKTRAMVADMAKDGQDFLKRKSGEVRESAVDAIDRGKKAVQQTTEGIVQALETGRRTLVG